MKTSDLGTQWAKDECTRITTALNECVKTLDALPDRTSMYAKAIADRARYYRDELALADKELAAEIGRTIASAYEHAGVDEWSEHNG